MKLSLFPNPSFKVSIVSNILYGDSYIIIVSVLSFMSSIKDLLSLFSLGKNPLNINLVVSNPEYIKAVVKAVAPGKTSNSIPSSIHFSTTTLPGSDIPGVPASLYLAHYAYDN